MVDPNDYRRSRRALSTIWGFSLAYLLIALLGFSSTATAQVHEESWLTGQPSRASHAARGIRIKRPRHVGALQPVTPQCVAPDLSYFGGPVISNAQVVLVYWNSDVSTTAQADLPTFFEGITDSTFYDTLSEYSTNVVSTPDAGQTNQSIGRGRYVGAYTIVPSVCPASTTAACEVTDAQIQTELSNQITKTAVPSPVYDSNGYDNTLYMVYFPPNVSISFFGISCVDWCAYHNTGGTVSNPIVYGVIPDTLTDACSTGCGGATPFENLTDTFSHEMAESVTDTEIGLDTDVNYAYPGAWGDNNNNCGEIADICDDGVGTIVPTPTGNYNINELWSNSLNACVSAGRHPGFKLTQPSTAVAGTPFNFTLTALNPSGGLGTDISYVGTVHFTSSDTASGVVLPANFTFVPGDQGSMTFSATLKTAGAQTITATDTVNVAITATTASITVSSGSSPAVTLTPTSLSFGTLGENLTSPTKTVTLKNVGTAALTITSIAVTGTDPGDFPKTATTCGSSLAAAATCTVSMTFKPTTTGARSADLTFTDNASGSPQQVPLSGTGTTAEITPTPLNFGTLGVGLTSPTKTVTLKNVGTAALTITSIAITGTDPGDFPKTATTCGSSLAAAATCTVSMTFKPTTTGARSANLKFTDNASGSPQQVPLSGIGTTAEITPTPLSFGTLGVGLTSPTKTVTLKNVGTAALTITSIAVTGTDAGDFQKTATTCGSSLAAAATCTVSMTFKPATTGSRSANLTFTDNASGSPQQVPLSGTGTTAEITPTPLSFGTLAVGLTSPTKTVTLKNVGTAALTITSIAVTGTDAGDFQKTATTCGSSLAAAATCTVSVTFKPTTTGARSADLTFTDGASGSPQQVPLSGTGS
jgi:hypothetical protein